MTPDDLKRSLGRVIARRRLAAGLSQADLARRLGWPKASLVNYEQGRRSPPLPALLAIADALHCRPGELLDDAV
jgi:transcriptional regulator with XRE-family HTH domain